MAMELDLLADGEGHGIAGYPNGTARGQNPSWNDEVMLLCNGPNPGPFSECSIAVEIGSSGSRTRRLPRALAHPGADPPPLGWLLLDLARRRPSWPRTRAADDSPSPLLVQGARAACGGSGARSTLARVGALVAYLAASPSALVMANPPQTRAASLEPPTLGIPGPPRTLAACTRVPAGLRARHRVVCPSCAPCIAESEAGGESRRRRPSEPSDPSVDLTDAPEQRRANARQAAVARTSSPACRDMSSTANRPPGASARVRAVDDDDEAHPRDVARDGFMVGRAACDKISISDVDSPDAHKPRVHLSRSRQPKSKHTRPSREAIRLFPPCHWHAAKRSPPVSCRPATKKGSIPRSTHDAVLPQTAWPRPVRMSCCHIHGHGGHLGIRAP
ncbi:hypothetical protein K505DRAFT_13986 [Melanomma pulvis-pyrius CBS 109.77]|uniref:Uncharacterized protein n=1 Tax=Melanomma pulvis-pyrius CBS 109.77 TaxID=1314802 RepID=A0A6A6WNG6_9PLEO|nr:hypothetical protein K505DRAFT_13986 [Melanomma pulvis-pyrius CBS 109.77]